MPISCINYVSEILEYTIDKTVSRTFIRSHHPWNNGMMEYWNIDFKKNSISKNPFLHYSSIPIGSKAN